MPCVMGTREQIEEARRRGQRERELERTDPLRIHWRELVKRFAERGIESLSEDERLYYAVNVLDGEVYNGGFDQFFFNSSGNLYALAERGLTVLDATASLSLLRGAKSVLFPDSPVPTDTASRRSALLARTDRAADFARLDPLDREYCEDPDDLGPKIERFALERRLV